MARGKMKMRPIAYCGRRNSAEGTLLDAFLMVDEAGSDFLHYKAARRCLFVIGQVYDGKISDDHTIEFSSFKAIDDRMVSTKNIAEWSAADAVARRTKENESARRKMQGEHREKWRERLEPLRWQYREMTAPQRRAMRQLIIEWLEN